MPSSAMTNSSWRAPEEASPASSRFFVTAYLTKSTSRIEVKPELGGTGVTHGDDRRKIPVLAAAHQRHRRAVTRRFRHGQLDILHGDHLEAIERRQRRARRGEDDREIRGVPPRVIDQMLDQHSRVVGIAMSRVAAHSTYPADAQSLPGERPREFVPLRARQHVGPLDERIATLMIRRPGGFPARSIGGCERSATETLV